MLHHCERAEERLQICIQISLQLESSNLSLTRPRYTHPSSSGFGMHVLLTGGNGFLAAHILNHLIERW